MDYRHTFLRRHIAGQLARTHRLDVLAVEKLLSQIELCGAVDADGVAVNRQHPAVRRWVNYRTFFYVTAADLRLYIPLRVQVAVGSKHQAHPTDIQLSADRRLMHQQLCQQATQAGEPYPTVHKRHIDTYEDLTQLIAAMQARWLADRDSDQRGIVLLSRSGAGKTVACWKAFYDCLFSTSGDDEPPQTPPRLEGFLPCWLPLEKPRWPADKREDLLPHLLALAGLTEVDRPRLEAWLRFGPPLLIFVDLNRAAAHHQLRFAEALIDFQRVWGRFGHRCIVTYRSTQGETGPMGTLAADRDAYFGFYDLLPLEVDEAVRYLRNLRQRETELATVHLKDYGITFPPRNVEQECALVEGLARAYVTEQGGARESFLSTPIIMHLVASLPDDVLHPACTLAELYDASVDAYIASDFERYSEQLAAGGIAGDAGRQALKTAMVRIALAILFAGEDTTTLEVGVARSLLADPTVDPITRRKPKWRPDSKFWHPSPVYWECFGRAAKPNDPQPHERGLNGVLIDTLFEFSLFRRAGAEEQARPPGPPAAGNRPAKAQHKTSAESLGLLHDSFLYHLCGAIALVDYHGPEQAALLDRQWCVQTAQWINESPRGWRNAAPFLAGRLQTLDRRLDDDEERIVDQLLRALLDEIDQVDWIEFLLRFCRGPRDDGLCREVAWVCLNNRRTLEQFPASAFGRVIDYLGRLKSSEPRIVDFLRKFGIDGEAHA